MNRHRTCVVGLGYIGLPTATILASSSNSVIGVDVDARIVKAVSEGIAHVREPGLDAILGQAVADGYLVAADHPECADAFILAVPTPIRGLFDKRADLSFVAAAANSVAAVLRTGNLVILESTAPPGTTVGLVARILERGSGLEVGKDFHLAHCPERVLPGRILHELVHNDRVIGGFDRRSAEVARDLYAMFVKGRMFLTDATTAELVKLMENTFRDVNIALANEFALVAEKLGVDVWEAIDIANHHPRVQILRPGPGVGGHCIAVDPWFVIGAAPEFTPLIASSRAVNDAMPLHVADLIAEAVGGLRGRHITVLGITYKADVDDVRESPSAEVVAHLRHGGATVCVHDAMVAAGHSVQNAATGADCVALLVDHAAYRELDPVAVGRFMRQRTVVDTRNVLSAARWQEAGFRVVRLGHGQREVSGLDLGGLVSGSRSA